jgi:hypothetical protein
VISSILPDDPLYDRGKRVYDALLHEGLTPAEIYMVMRWGMFHADRELHREALRQAAREVEALSVARLEELRDAEVMGR